MLIRPATAQDLHQVHAIYMHEDVVPYLGYDPMPVSAFAPIHEQLLASTIFDVAQIDGRVAGFCRVLRQEGRASHVAVIGPFAVRPDCKGQGVARALMENVIARLRARGIVRVELMAEHDNPRAIAFYGKLGFRHEATLRKAYKRSTDAHYTDECLMALFLDDAAPG